MKKIIGFFIALVMFTTCATPTFAIYTDSNEWTIEVDGVRMTVYDEPSEGKYTVKVEYDDHYEIAVKNRITNVIITQIYDLEGHLLDEFSTDEDYPKICVNLGCGVE